MGRPASRPVCVRIAPSPTGEPHVGTGYIALFDYAFAKANNGKFVLRIEDTDRERSTRESEQAIFEALHWLGLAWDEGPDIGGPHAPYRQSERSELYRKYGEELVAKKAAYRCFCTPERLQAMRKIQRMQKLPTGYDGKCRDLSEREVKQKLGSGMPHVIRLAVPSEGKTLLHDLVRGEVVFENSSIDDQVLIKSDGFPTYHLANVVDDHLMEVTHVIRAEEWIVSTPKHLLLYRAFGWEPPVFVHMPLLRNADKSKISKRKNPTSLLWYRQQGYLPEALRNFLALMGWSAPDGREVFSLEEMIQDFSWERVAKSAPVFDLQKLDWLNGVHIRNQSVSGLVERVREACPESRALDEARMRTAMPLVQERMKKLCDFMPLTKFLFTETVAPSAGELVPKKTTPDEALRMLEKAREALDGVSDWATAPLEHRCRSLAEKMSVKARSLFMCLRVAVTGTTVSPPLFESMELLGREKTLARVEAARAKLDAAGT